MATKRKRIKGSGGLYLRGATWWMSYSINGTQFRESTGQTQKQAAQDVLNKKLAAVTLGLVTVRQAAQPKTTDVLTVEKLLEYVVRDYEVRKKPSLKSLRGYVKKLSAKIGEQPAGAITYSRLFELQQRWLSEGVSE